MPRLTRFITSFAAVLGAYWLYVLVAVPLIEPAAAGHHDAADGHRGAARRIDNRLGELQQLVPPEARAQLQTPWIIESDDFKLLMQKYTNRDDGRVMIEPCVLIYTPGSSKENAAPKPPIVLYAPAGAMMVFARPLNLRAGPVDCPTSGRLLGEITITSPGQSPGPEDDLRIVTRDVQLLADQISTTNTVDFRYGASVGKGRNLVIKLRHNEESSRSSGNPPDVQGIESFELLELDRLHLELQSLEKNKPAPPAAAETPAAPGAPAAPETPAAPGQADDGSAELDMKRPLEITCRGPFRFDLVRQFARFQDQVNVLQLNPDGPADQLNCELLTLSFSRSRDGLVKLDGKQAPPDPLEMDNMELELRKIEAKGNPVIVRAFSRDAEARGDWLTYDIEQNSVALGGDNEAFLRQATNEIHARSISYRSKGKGRLGEIFSQGPGWMKGTMRDGQNQQIFMEWGDRLQLEPYDDQHLATLSGGVKLEYAGAGLGTLTAERIDLWLFELPAGPQRKKVEIQPDRMLVQKQVVIHSPEVDGKTDVLKVWFKQLAEASPASAPRETAAPTAQSPTPSAQPAPSPLAGPLQPQPADKPIERRFQVAGAETQACFLLSGNQGKLTGLMLDGNVQLDEIPLVPTSGRPMHLQGDRLQVFDAHDMARTRLSVIGRLAEFHGQGVMLSGTNINVDAGTNHLGINGSGTMKLPVERDLNGQPLQTPGEITITWQKEMDFDGQTARFEEKVVACTEDQVLQTEVLEARFADRIDFRNLRSKSRPKAELAQLACRGGVFMEGRTFQEQPAPPAAGPQMYPASLPADTASRQPLQESWEQFQAVELSIDRTSGAVFARGPGRITTIRTKRANPLDARGLAAQPVPAAFPAGGKQLVYLDIEFPLMMTGNLTVGEATFSQRIRCVYEEVDSWQPRIDLRNPDLLSQRGMLLTADRLTVAKAPAMDSNKTVELEAQGNVTAENATFTGRADRMTYSQDKDWLILEGNGYAPAELSYQEYPGAPSKSYPAGKIRYSLTTKDVRVVDGGSMQMDALPMP